MCSCGRGCACFCGAMKLKNKNTHDRVPVREAWKIFSITFGASTCVRRFIGCRSSLNILLPCFHQLWRYRGLRFLSPCVHHPLQMVRTHFYACQTEGRFYVVLLDQRLLMQSIYKGIQGGSTPALKLVCGPTGKRFSGSSICAPIHEVAWGGEYPLTGTGTCTCTGSPVAPLYS